MNHINNLKGKSPRGYRNQLSKEYDIPYWKVSAILEGRVKDEKGLVNRAYQLAIEHQKSNKSNNQNLNSLISELEQFKG